MAAVGEVLLCGPETAGRLLSLTRFNGNPVVALGGGFNRLYVVEAGGRIYSLVRTDMVDSGVSTDVEVEVFALDHLGSISAVVCGRTHTLYLTQEGVVFSSGQGTFGVLGHGGALEAISPVPIKVLYQRVVKAIACGEFHSLALTDKGDCYSWGRGFEGQLGLREDVLSASTPKYVKAFSKRQVTAIACGYNHSLAVCEGRVYTWGEGRSGQLGTGKTRQRNVPQIVDILKSEGGEEAMLSVSGGAAHSLAVTVEGNLYSWGLNNYGQLGLGDFDVRWKPTAVKNDLVGISLKALRQAVCGAYTSYAIDIQGNLYSWGRGYIGHKHETLEDTPRRIEHNTEHRQFTGVFSCDHSALFFAPLRVYSISPFCGPSFGGTRLSLIGTAFSATSNLKVRLRSRDLALETEAEFDSQSHSLLCLTPSFPEDAAWPIEFELNVTMDGVNYVTAEQVFLVYSNDLFPSSVMPKCATVAGGTNLSLAIDLSQFDKKWLWHLTVGFLPKPKMTGLNRSSNTQNSTPANKLHDESHVSGFSARADEATSEADWRLTAARYAKGKVECKVPVLYEYDENTMVYMIDVAINGQQFTGKPLNFRYYDVAIFEVVPLMGSLAENTLVKIVGRGLYDSSAKKVRVSNEHGEREVQVLWDNKTKTYMCNVPPLVWLFGETVPDAETLKGAAKLPLVMELTLNGIDYIDLPSFRYIDIGVVRISKAKFDPALKPDQVAELWHAPEEVVHEDNEIRIKREQEEAAELLLPVKPGAKLYVWAEELIQTPDLSAAFILDSQVVPVPVVFKHSKKLGVEVPNLGELLVPTDVVIEISLNGQKYSQNGRSFKYLGASAPEEQPKKRR